MGALCTVDFVATYTSPAFKAAGKLILSTAMPGHNIDALLLQQQPSPPAKRQKVSKGSNSKKSKKAAPSAISARVRTKFFHMQCLN
jgi:uncharacterized protein involved in outer membrane biogenesis